MSAGSFAGGSAFCSALTRSVTHELRMGAGRSIVTTRLAVGVQAGRHVSAECSDITQLQYRSEDHDHEWKSASHRNPSTSLLVARARRRYSSARYVLVDECEEVLMMDQGIPFDRRGRAPISSRPVRRPLRDAR